MLGKEGEDEAEEVGLWMQNNSVNAGKIGYGCIREILDTVE